MMETWKPLDPDNPRAILGAEWEVMTADAQNPVLSFAENALRGLDLIRDQVEEDIGHAITAMRSNGETWTEIANVLDVSKQAVQQRYGGVNAQSETLASIAAEAHARKARARTPRMREATAAELAESESQS